jgi:hypothetical protein
MRQFTDENPCLCRYIEAVLNIENCKKNIDAL